MELAFQCEINPHSHRVLEHHWPELDYRYKDIHDITEPPPRIDVLTGGFPCQDYSVAGRGAGLAGDRGALWWEYHRLIARIRPTWVIGENVPGLLSSRGGRDFETIVRSLTELGYGVAWAVLDAQYFGVAQRRRRVFVIGHSGGRPRPEVVALAEGLYGHPEPSRETRETVAALTRKGADGGGAPDDNSAQAGHLVPQTIGALRERDWRGPPIDVDEPALIVNSAQDPITSTVAQPLDDNARASQAVAYAGNQRDEFRKMELAGALHTRMSMKQATYVMDDAAFHTVRRLTPLECERLQGFPDGWTDIEGNANTNRFRQLGNAVAVPVAEWLLGNVMETD
jgi:DNA (cytosine-5)-methyltransferase 1